MAEKKNIFNWLIGDPETETAEAPKKAPKTEPKAETPKPKPKPVPKAPAGEVPPLPGESAGTKTKEESSMDRERSELDMFRDERPATRPTRRDTNPFGLSPAAPAVEPETPAKDPVIEELRRRVAAYDRIENARPVVKAWYIGKKPYDAAKYAEITGEEPAAADAIYLFTDTDGKHLTRDAKSATEDDMFLWECKQRGLGKIVV